jgi:HemY protein
MLKFLILLAFLFAIAIGFHWLKDTSGEVTLTIGDTVYAVDLTTAVIGAIAFFLAAFFLVLIVRAILNAPGRVARGWRTRNAERGRLAISQGLIAVAAGDIRTAERAVLEASRRTPDLPLTRLLEAQTAQLTGDRAKARQVFQDMTEEPSTRIAGLRGLYIEAEREGEREAAHQIAERARIEAPSAPWAARALLRHQTAAADWEGALRTLSGAVDGRVLDKRTARRQRAVILTARALAEEEGEPDSARQAALEAHQLAPDLVAAAVVAGRLLTRQGEVRRATRVLEATWKAGPHPEVTDAYLHVRPGDSASDRLKRAETLFRMRPQADEGRHAVARAAIDARDFARAREVLTPVLTSRPTRKALILMAELVESETDDRGQAREWLARAVNAPRDPVWTADGIILEGWAPVSPVTGRIDTVEWKAPVAELEPPHLAIDAAELKAPALTAPDAQLPAEESATAERAAGTASGLQGALAASPERAIADAPTVAPASPGGRPTGQRTNGQRGLTDAAVPPSHGAAPPDAELEPPAAEPLQPRPPDDPGVSDDAEEEDLRRFRVL